MVKGLIAQDFQVSLLARPTSKFVNHYNLTILRSDFSPASLVEALTGQDAIVSTLGFTGLAEQVKIVDAAEKAGVRRFIPSEFGSNTMKPSLPEFEALMDVKLSLLKHLKERAAANPTFTWTGIANGPFFDWVSLLNPYLYHFTPRSFCSIVCSEHCWLDLAGLY